MAVPKVFQTFNSLLGSIVRKRNATIVGPSKQLVGEFPPVTFERLYEYYHGWDQIKRAVDTMHQKFMGAGIEVNSNNNLTSMLSSIVDANVTLCCKAERLFLSRMESGCFAPIGCLANINMNQEFTMTGYVASGNGAKELKKTRTKLSVPLGQYFFVETTGEVGQSFSP